MSVYTVELDKLLCVTQVGVHKSSYFKSFFSPLAMGGQ